MAQYNAKRFFSDRSFPLTVKITVYLTTLLFFASLLLVNRQEWLSLEEWRLVLYLFYLLIFINTYYCGFAPGITSAVFASLVAVTVFAPEGAGPKYFSFANQEVFPFVAKYFLLTIVANWIRKIIEQLQQQLLANKQLQIHAQRLEKLMLAGEIAAGIAHEIRNPLTVIQGYLQVIESKCKKLCNTPDSFTLLQDELKRTNQIISDFLRFSRPDKPQRTLTQLHTLLKSASSLLYGELLRKKIQLEIFPAPDMPQIHLDENQIIQVFLNLFNNSVQAMPNGGTISVYTSYDEKNESVTIRISDSGTGIAPEAMKQIFIPFYTTKENGTGLGLVITQAIVIAHGGTIQAESSAGEGTSFTISLPANTPP
jgi:signal transduction histidine kinase